MLIFMRREMISSFYLNLNQIRFRENRRQILYGFEKIDPLQLKGENMEKSEKDKWKGDFRPKLNKKTKAANRREKRNGSKKKEEFPVN